MEMIHTCYRVTDRDDATLQRLAGQGIEPERRPYQVRGRLQALLRARSGSLASKVEQSRLVPAA
jgi:hypothetical protein